MQTDGEGLEPWALMTSVGIVQRQPRSGTRLGGYEVIACWITCLERTPVSHETEHHADAARVVDPVATDRVNQPESLETAGFESTNWIKRHMTVQYRIGSGLSGRPHCANQFICYYFQHCILSFCEIIYLKKP